MADGINLSEVPGAEFGQIGFKVITSGATNAPPTGTTFYCVAGSGTFRATNDAAGSTHMSADGTATGAAVSTIPAVYGKFSNIEWVSGYLIAYFG